MLRALSMGGGVQTTCLALLAAEGLWQRPDVAIFADTQWEPAAVYQHLDWLAGVLPFPVLRVTAGSLRENLVTRTNTSGSKYAAIPYFTADGIGRRQCTHEYKLKPIHRELRRLLGKGPRDAIKPGTVELQLGISMDEAHRMTDSGVRYIKNTYPLISLEMTRADCLRWLERAGYPRPPKSACIGCPFTSDRRWMERREREPAEWADAVEADRLLRRSGEYMHESRVPLWKVDFSRIDPDRQPDLFGNECTGHCGT